MRFSSKSSFGMSTEGCTRRIRYAEGRGVRAAYQVLLDSQVQPTRVQERAAWMVI